MMTNDDIFHLLCSYWFSAEVSEAKNRLLSIKPINTED